VPYGTDFNKDKRAEWIESEDMKIGGQWFFRVGIIKDGDGVKKVRMAKCEKKPDGKISEVQKLNFKRRSDFDPLIPLVQRMLDKIEGANPLGQPKNGLFRRSPVGEQSNKV